MSKKPKRNSSGTLSTDGAKKPHPEIVEIDNRRMELGIPIEDLCRVAGVRSRTYRYWRTGAKSPYSRNRAAMRRALKALTEALAEQ